MSLRSPALLPALIAAAAVAAGGEARFMTQPDIRGERIVFAWEGDLYATGLEGGTAIRLTGHPSGELAPKISPDGKWIAYTTANDNVLDVWVMPSEGGAPTRLTWPPLGGQVWPGRPTAVGSSSARAGGSRRRRATRSSTRSLSTPRCRSLSLSTGPRA